MMYYLVLGIWANSGVIIPEKYSLDECRAAGKRTIAPYISSASGADNYYRCVPAPRVDKVELK